MTHNAANIAEAIQAKLVVIATQTGGTAWVKAKQRNYIPTLGVSNSPATLRRMCLFWGIMPTSSRTSITASPFRRGLEMGPRPGVAHPRRSSRVRNWDGRHRSHTQLAGGASSAAVSLCRSVMSLSNVAQLSPTERSVIDPDRRTTLNRSVCGYGSRG